MIYYGILEKETKMWSVANISKEKVEKDDSKQERKLATFPLSVYGHLQKNYTDTIFVALICVTVECYLETSTGHKGGSLG